MIHKIETISELHKMLGMPTLHPLVSIIDFSKIDIPKLEGSFSFGFYFASIKEKEHCKISYGRNKYDYQDDSMIFIAPNQVLGIEANENQNQDEASGIVILFHPDLLRGLPLSKSINDHKYFNYDVNEALHLSAIERKTIGDCFDKINHEISLPIDKHSRRIIVASIELLLSYCQRFYDRQFITREIVNKDTLSKFENILNDYYSSDNQTDKGIPSVRYIAEKLALSPNYMSDLIKRETGRSAIEHIYHSIIDKAKTELVTTNKTVSEIAYYLGFDYPQYFSRQFKKHTGLTPNEYRALA